MTRILMLLVALTWSVGAIAAQAPQLLRAEVTGTIQVNADGTVREVTLKDALGQGVSAALARRIKQWRFTPRAPTEQVAQGDIVLRLEASEWPDRTDIRVVNATFRRLETSTDSVPVTTRPGPRIARPLFPGRLQTEAIGGTVTVIVTLDGDGRVVATAVEDAVVVDYRGSRKNYEAEYARAVKLMYASAVEALKKLQVGDTYWPGEAKAGKRMQIPFSYDLVETRDRGWVEVTRVVDLPDPWKPEGEVEPVALGNFMGSMRLLNDLARDPVL